MFEFMISHRSKAGDDHDDKRVKVRARVSAARNEDIIAPTYLLIPLIGIKMPMSLACSLPSFLCSSIFRTNINLLRKYEHLLEENPSTLRPSTNKTSHSSSHKIFPPISIPIDRLLRPRLNTISRPPVITILIRRLGSSSMHRNLARRTILPAHITRRLPKARMVRLDT